VVILIKITQNAEETTIKCQVQYNKTMEKVTCKELHETLDPTNYCTVLYMPSNIEFILHFTLPLSELLLMYNLPQY
jgi:hypothetical protein